MDQFRKFLRGSAVPKDVLDVFLDPSQPSWAQFDPELGYRLGNIMAWGGVDGSRPIYSVEANGARTSVMYRGVPCRINTYGDSFTECEQVNDFETWQEILGAHFGEPLRNFGMGGYGVYQAYRRMVRTEVTADGVAYVLLYLWGDDHLRSLMRCRYALIYPWYDNRGGRLFHNNFWAHLEMDLETGCLEEKPNLLATPSDLYRMTDPDFMEAALRDDWALQLAAFTYELVDEIEREPVNRLAEILGCPAVAAGTVDEMRAAAARVRDAYAFAATRSILDQAFAFTQAHGKQLMILLFDPAVAQELINTGRRYDQPVVDDLDRRGVRYFDMNLVHVDDFKNFNLSVDDYFSRYLIGHYNPAGNHLFAFALKHALLDWLEPRPVTYRE